MDSRCQKIITVFAVLSLLAVSQLHARPIAHDISAEKTHLQTKLAHLPTVQFNTLVGGALLVLPALGYLVAHALGSLEKAVRHTPPYGPSAIEGMVVMTTVQAGKLAYIAVPANSLQQGIVNHGEHVLHGNTNIQDLTYFEDKPGEVIGQTIKKEVEQFREVLKRQLPEAKSIKKHEDRTRIIDSILRELETQALAQVRMVKSNTQNYEEKYLQAKASYIRDQAALNSTIYNLSDELSKTKKKLEFESSTVGTITNKLHDLDRERISLEKQIRDYDASREGHARTSEIALKRAEKAEAELRVLQDLLKHEPPEEGAEQEHGSGGDEHVEEVNRRLHFPTVQELGQFMQSRLPKNPFK